MALDAQVQRDGDMGFAGYASRLNPLTLPAGMLQDSVNMRLDRGVARTRKGAKRLADSISAGEEPLTLSFQLAADLAIDSITFSGPTATVTTASAHGLPNGTIVNIAGATGADGAKYNGDFAIFDASGSTFKYTMTGTPDANATGTLVANAGPVVKETYAGGIFAAGVFASRNYDNANEYIVMAGPSEAYLWRNGSPDTIVTVGYASGETIDPQDTVSIVQAYDRLYILREAPIDPNTTFKQQVTNASGITVSGTTATVNVDDHGLSAGMRVRIEGSTVPAFDGHEFEILASPVVTEDAFSITVPSGTATAGVSGIKVRRVKAPMYWTGSGSFVKSASGVPTAGATYKTMPSVGWAAYLLNRLVLPSGRDGVLISDILDADLYDPFWQSLRAGAGGNDHIVAVHPYADGGVLVFCRKSIWLATLNQTYDATNGDSLIARMDLLTDEIGCSARNSIATAGQFVFFLSDAGVYRLDSQLDLKLRGDTRPLSDPIADLFERIDQSKVNRAYGIWHNNRYLLAVPTVDGPDDTNDLVVVYNALNDQWETRDTYSIGVDSLVVGTYSNVRRLFNVRRTGKLYLLDENDDGTDDEPSGLGAGQVEGQVVTRRFSMGQIHPKRFLRALADVEIPAGGTVQIDARLLNPDDQITLLPAQTNAGVDSEDHTLKQPIRRKAHAMELVFKTTLGRPEIRNASVEAAMQNLPPTNTRNAA